ncbi:MAG: hypothetical protein IKJ37_14780 [Kiritimatiellae bacterium]|nr:hypothetical protein [Kiritimatiellia bacterium]
MANGNTNPGIGESVDPGVCGYIVLRVLPIARWDVWDARDAEMRKVESSTNSHKSSQIGFVQICGACPREKATGRQMPVFTRR